MGTAGCDQGNCTNTHGGYECSCRAGFLMVGARSSQACARCPGQTLPQLAAVRQLQHLSLRSVAKQPLSSGFATDRGPQHLVGLRATEHVRRRCQGRHGQRRLRDGLRLQRRPGSLLLPHVRLPETANRALANS